jgi:hypothetical protein
MAKKVFGGGSFVGPEVIKQLSESGGDSVFGPRKRCANGHWSYTTDDVCTFRGKNDSPCNEPLQQA